MCNCPEKEFAKKLSSNTCNVYRTDNFIVRQKVCITIDEETSIIRTVSEDTYFLRTPERDIRYECIFAGRGKKLDGKRIRVAMYTREYIE